MSASSSSAAIPAFDRLHDLVALARRQGADEAEVVLDHGVSLDVSCRGGVRENLEQADGLDIGLRVFIGRRQAMVTASHLDADSVPALVGRALDMARVAPENPHCGLADPEQLVGTHRPDLDMFDSVPVNVDVLTQRARQAETAAMAVRGVTQCDKAQASWSHGVRRIVSSNGFVGEVRRSMHQLRVSAVAGIGGAMQRDYAYAQAVYGRDLERPEITGARAGGRAMRRLGARAVANAQLPVMLDPRVGRSLLGHLASAINGSAVAREVSFLREAMGQPVFAPSITILDDPHRARGMRSRPFDAEGLATHAMPLIEAGVLKSWMLDLASARQLGLSPTGHAARAAGGLPHPAASNLFIKPGVASPTDMMADIKQGLYVTDFLGSGVDLVSGHFSQGCSGLWIENGVAAYPVEGLTIAGHLRDVFRVMQAASDLDLRYGIDSPTLHIGTLTIAGNAAS
ncbi:MAG: TldD/PmbA family protein [Alphaproteobacteria bacterium]|nr:MAG: TldD/PmbA family protein [Alphaproteobacteria bacterium]